MKCRVQSLRLHWLVAMNESGQIMSQSEISLGSEISTQRSADDAVVRTTMPLRS